MVFPVVMYGCELDLKESWELKNWCFWTAVLEKTPESPLHSKNIKPINPKGNQSWIIHWKDWCWSWNSNSSATGWEELTHWKRPWCWEELGAGGEGDNSERDGWMASPTQWVSLRELRKLVIDREANSWGHKESDTTERLNWTELNCEELTRWKRPWCCERLRAWEEGGDRGWEVVWHHQFDGH